MQLDPTPKMLAIIAHARAGAVDHAFRLFQEAGLDSAIENPRALSLRGRLLKERGARALGEERDRILRAAAEDYRRSAELQPSSYALINAATLYLLAGDVAVSQDLARRVLELICTKPDEPETAYWRGATGAEALLLLGRTDQTQAALTAAIAIAPQAWEDHASTLRQFKLILAARREDVAWLAPFRPPRSIHFGGHMSFDSKVGRRGRLDEAIASVLDEENVGFGFGALAAGADIIIAEALLANGGELHLILPGGPEAFAARSVDPFGPEWRARFDAVLTQADTVRPIRPIGASPTSESIALGDEVAMGSALINARRFESEALQLLVVDADGPDLVEGATGRALAHWAEAGWRQRLVATSREASPAPMPPFPPVRPRAQTLALLSVRHAEAGPKLGAVSADLTNALVGLKEVVERFPPPTLGPYWSGDEVLIGFESVSEAGNAGLSLAEAGWRVGGHYLVATPFTEPFSESARVSHHEAAPASAAAASTPSQTACVTDDFAAALAVSGDDSLACEYVGELETHDAGPPVGLYALKRAIR